MFTQDGLVAWGARRGVSPQWWRMREALGRIWIPAPTCEGEGLGCGGKESGGGGGRERRIKGWRIYFCYFRGTFEDCDGVAGEEDCYCCS